MVPLFGLVDCNNFYASCERVFRPTLEGRPVVVLSNNDGCVIARSNEAKALGFRMGDPYHLNRDKIKAHAVAVCSSNYTLYGDMSRRVMTTLEACAPELEVYSIDEAFLNLTGMDDRNLPEFAETLRTTVRQHTGIPVSIGIGRTKTLAKAANKLAKASPARGGLCDLSQVQDVDDVLQAVAVADVWGVGRQWAAWLEGQGILTARDLKHADPKAIRRKMTVVGERIVYELQGISCIPLELTPDPQKGVTVSRSFGQLISDLPTLREALLQFIGRAAEKLRRQGLMTHTVTVFAHSNRFDTSPNYYGKIQTVRLPGASDDTAELIHYGTHLLERIYRPGVKFQKCGVMLLDLVPANRDRRDLLDSRDHEKRARLMQAVDTLNATHGRHTVQFGSFGNLGGRTARWTARADLLSPRWTTSWAEIPAVR